MEVNLKILRFNPETDKKPHYEKFTIVAHPTYKILDCLMHVKNEQDGTLTFRRSCVHGICGSDGMKINGKAGLACQRLVRDYKTRNFTIEPLPGFPIVKDLVVDFSCFFANLSRIMPWFINDDPKPRDSEQIMSQNDAEEILEAVKCVLCGSCTSSCPSSWMSADYLGPAALLKAYRFIADSRDKASDERIKVVNSQDGAWRCHTIFNCVEACPKDIHITDHIVKLRKRIFMSRI